MKLGLSTRIEKIDFEYIIENATKKELWQKTWTIFEYEDWTFTMELAAIFIKDNKLSCEVRCNKLTYYTKILTLPLDKAHRNIIVFSNELVNDIVNLIMYQEQQELKRTKDYIMYQNLDSQYRQNLRDKAEEILDLENVSNTEIRDIFMDNYESDNESNYAGKYLSDNSCTIFNHIILSACLFLDNRKKYDEYYKKIEWSTRCSIPMIEILEEVKCFFENQIDDEIILEFDFEDLNNEIESLQELSEEDECIE